ncbi:MAG: GntR family transcriptional regulator [Pseudomonadota bacterium]
MNTHAPATDTTAHAQAYARLRHRVLVGDLAPGEKLTLRGLAAELGLSATPVREALRRLAAEGALRVLENRRVQVPKPTAAQLIELVHLRCALETHLAARALPFVNDHLIAHMRDTDDRIDTALASRDYADAVLLNQRFHTLLFTANPLGVGLPLVESLWLQLGPCMRIAAGRVDALYPEDHHKRLLLALEARDSTAVQRVLIQDIQAGFGELSEVALQAVLA